MSAVPVIDLTAWFHGDENDRRQAAARVDDAVSAGPLDRWRSNRHRVLPPAPSAPDEELLSLIYVPSHVKAVGGITSRSASCSLPSSISRFVR